MNSMGTPQQAGRLEARARGRRADDQSALLSARGLNRCTFCGRMARWDDLEFQIDYDMDINGTVAQYEYYQHKDIRCMKK